MFRIYRGEDNIIDNTQNPNTWRASASYVTGSHNLKFGYKGAYYVEQTTDLSSDLGYTITDLSFIAPGFSSATIRIAPWQQSNRTESHALYAQDQWTHRARDASGSGPVRPRLQLVPGRSQRRATGRHLEQGADHIPGNARA